MVNDEPRIISVDEINEGEPSPEPQNSDEYWLNVLDEKGKTIASTGWNPVENDSYWTPAPDPNTGRITGRIERILPMTTLAEKIVIVGADGKQVDSKGLGFLGKKCGNGVCNAGENAANCPADCQTSGNDGYCDGPNDNRCDADCNPSWMDPDCSIELATPLAIEKTSTPEKPSDAWTAPTMQLIICSWPQE